MICADHQSNQSPSEAANMPGGIRYGLPAVKQPDDLGITAWELQDGLKTTGWVSGNEAF